MAFNPELDKEFNVDVFEPDDITMFGKEAEFNHPALVTIAYHNVLKTGAEEMRKGYWETKPDKFGGSNMKWNEDTRQKYINSVETLKNCMIAKFDKEAQTKITKLKEQSKQLKEKAKVEEEMWYSRLPIQIKRTISHIPGHLNKDLIFSQNYVDDLVWIYREMFEEIEKLLSRTKYLKKKILIA